MPIYASLAEAYSANLRVLLTEGDRVEGVQDRTSVGSEFGSACRSTLELRPFGFVVANPRECMIECASRQPDLAYAIGQWLWVMRGSDNLDEIAFYNGRGRAFSDDGDHLSGAFGPRMVGGMDQLRSALRLIRSDPSTRRALIVVARARDVWFRSRDHSCAVSSHFLMRHGHLEAITTMRSQSALKVLPYDAALFMTLHVWVSASLGVPCGRHTWVANSMHVYEDEIPLVNEVLSGQVNAVELPPTTDPDGGLARLQPLEGDVREAVLAGNSGQLREIGGHTRSLDEMHAAMLRVLVWNGAARIGDDELAGDVSYSLPAGWDALLVRPPVPAPRSAK